MSWSCLNAGIRATRAPPLRSALLARGTRKMLQASGGVAALHVEAGTLPAGFIKSPGGDIINNIIFQGKPNPPGHFKGSKYGISDVDAVSEGAKRAIDVVTATASKAGVEGQEANQDLMTSECVTELRRAMANRTDEELENAHISFEDIYLSWVGKLGQPSDSEVLLHFITVSARGVGEAIATEEENKKRIAAFKEELQRNPAADGAEFKARTEALTDTLTPVSMPKSPIMITNVLLSGRLEGEEATDWRVAALYIKEASKVLHPVFFFRWRVRLSFALKGVRYLSVLRYDYASDLALVTLMFALFFNSITV